jgi:hypothetical protein
MWRYKAVAKVEGDLVTAEFMADSGNEAIAKAPKFFPEGAEIQSVDWVNPIY